MREGGRVVASPYARKLAREAGVEVGDASGSGPGGRIVAADVQQLISSGASTDVAACQPALLELLHEDILGHPMCMFWRKLYI